MIYPPHSARMRSACLLWLVRETYFQGMNEGNPFRMCSATSISCTSRGRTQPVLSGPPDDTTPVHPEDQTNPAWWDPSLLQSYPCWFRCSSIRITMRTNLTLRAGRVLCFKVVLCSQVSGCPIPMRANDTRRALYVPATMRVAAISCKRPEEVPVR